MPFSSCLFSFTVLVEVDEKKKCPVQVEMNKRDEACNGEFDKIKQNKKTIDDETCANQAWLCNMGYNW